MAKAANSGNAVAIYAPTTYEPGSSISHLKNTPSGVMLPGIFNGENKRTFTNVDLAILIDIGWNQYVWNNNTTGNWGGFTSSSSGSPWRNLDGASAFSPVGTITPNMVLTFGGTGGYTSTNDLTLTNNQFLINRLILNATAGTSTIAAGGANVMKFDTTIGITPLIRQDGAGAFNISHPIQTTTSNLQLGGDGAGRVTLSGAVSGNGAVTKLGTSTFALTGNNSYSGTTTVSAGTLLVNGQTGSNSGTGTGSVVVENGGTLGGTGRTGGTGTTLTVNSGGTVAPGDPTANNGVGTLTVGHNVAFASGSVYSVDIRGAAANTGYDRLDVTGTVNLGSATLTRLLGGGYTPSLSDLLFILVNDGTDAITGTFSGLANGDSFTLGSTTAYIYYTGDSATSSLTGGNDVVIAFTSAVPVPEPGTVLAFAAAALGLAGLGRRAIRFRQARA